MNEFTQWLQSEIDYARWVLKTNAATAFYTHGRLLALMEAQVKWQTTHSSGAENATPKSTSSPTTNEHASNTSKKGHGASDAS